MASCERSVYLRRERLVGSATSVGRVAAHALCQPTLWLGSSHSPSSPPPLCSSALPAAAGRICPTGCDGQLRSLAGLGGNKKPHVFRFVSSTLTITRYSSKTKNSPLPWRVFAIASQHTERCTIPYRCASSSYTRVLVPRIGVEPTTFSLGRSRSIQLSYQGMGIV